MQAKRVQCVCVCARARARACVRACVRVCVMNLVYYQNYARYHLHGFLIALLRPRTFGLASPRATCLCLALPRPDYQLPRLVNLASVL